MAMLKSGLDHVQVAMPAGEEARARAFYGATLGLTEIEKPEPMRKRGGAWYALGDGRQLHLGVEDDFRPSRKAHPCFVCADAERLAGQLAASGAEVRWDDAISGVKRFFSDDCFGNRLEFTERTDAAEG